MMGLERPISFPNTWNLGPMGWLLAATFGFCSLASQQFNCWEVMNSQKSIDGTSIQESKVFSYIHQVHVYTGE